MKSERNVCGIREVKEIKQEVRQDSDMVSIGEAGAKEGYRHTQSLTH